MSFDKKTGIAEQTGCCEPEEVERHPDPKFSFMEQTAPAETTSKHITKTFWKIETANAIFWMYLGGTAQKMFLFRNKTFLFFKIES